MLKGWSMILRSFTDTSKAIRKLVDIYFGTSDGHQKKFAKMPFQLYQNKVLDIIWN